MMSGRKEKVVADFLELAERCEDATGPDRSLDVKIALACLPEYAGWIEHPANNGNQYGEIAPSRETFDEWLIHDGEPCLYAVPAYTASIDAAMSLVIEGWEDVRMHHHKMNDGSIRCYAEIEFALRDMSLTGEAEKAATPALALCAAALRARAAA